LLGKAARRPTEDGECKVNGKVDDGLHGSGS
jgi:hypothetical protein